MQVPNVPDQFDLPSELCMKPLALVGLSGLDTLNNAVHKSIWEIFTSNRRVERAPVLFKLISNAHEFPVVKPKRNTYEWYIPKGILKRNWMNKHLSEVPSVIVVFYDLDWNDIQWNEKMIECASRVQSIRAALDGRDTRITVVLIQSSPLPAGEDMIASERATALCASCELNAKSLFVLPHVDHLQGYAVRLENAFYDLAQNYYHMETRNIKSHREHLNKTTHQYLFVRHQFKMGFLNELKQDIHTAHKHYTHAYNNLLEIRIVDTNAMEIRTVAAFINYKLCRLMFVLNLPRDAISQFRAHTERFKARIGFQELAFEHHAWLSKQYSMFGDIFDEAVKLGLPAVQTQHPGIYYQQAAQHSILRRQACEESCNHVIFYPAPDPLEGINNLEYYGQRPWRPGKLSAEPPDQHLESNGIAALQYLERQVNHSTIIITMYGLAISQYKTYKCPRTRRHLVVQMADEYFNSKDYGKALTLLTHMLWDYRTERWWTILTNIIQKAIRCAYLTANIQDYVILTLEILGKYTTAPVDYKKKMYENFCRVLNRQLPEPEKDLPSVCVQNAISLWQQLLTSHSLQFALDMNNIVLCVDCKARFLKKTYEADENVIVEIYIKSSCMFPLLFSRASAVINTPGYSSEYDSKKQNNPIATLNSNEIKKFFIEFTPDLKDIHKEIQIGEIHLQLGTVPNCIIELKFSGLGSETNSIYSELQHFRNSPHNMPDFNNIKTQTSATIVPRHSNLNLVFKHDNPVLLGEWYEVIIDVINKESHRIQEVEFEITLADDDGIDSTEFSASSSLSPEKLPLNIRLKNLEPSELGSLKLYMRPYKIGERTINCKVSFILASERPVASVKTEVLHVSIVKPFEVATQYLSTLFEDLNKFYVGEELVVMPVISCLSPWPIVIEGTLLEFGQYVLNANSNSKSELREIHLKNKEIGSEVYLATPKRHSDKAIDIGLYTIRWKRLNGHLTTTQLTLAGLMIEWIPLGLKVTLPEHGYVRTPVMVKYHLFNRSQQLVQLDVNMEASEAFMFAGYKQVFVLPESERVLEYNLYPLIAGSVALPKLVLSIPENSTEGPSLRQEQLNLLIERTLPTHLFVMPQVKGHPKLVDIPRIAVQ